MSDDLDLKRLRQGAEEDGPNKTEPYRVTRFLAHFDKPTILRLLDRVESAERLSDDNKVAALALQRELNEARQQARDAAKDMRGRCIDAITETARRTEEHGGSAARALASAQGRVSALPLEVQDAEDS